MSPFPCPPIPVPISDCFAPYTVEAWVSARPNALQAHHPYTRRVGYYSMLEVWERYGPHTEFTEVRVFWRRLVDVPGEEPRYKERLLCARGGSYSQPFPEQAALAAGIQP